MHKCAGFFLRILFGGNAFLSTKCICSHIFIVDQSLGSILTSQECYHALRFVLQILFVSEAAHVFRQAWTLEFEKCHFAVTTHD